MKNIVSNISKNDLFNEVLLVKKYIDKEILKYQKIHLYIYYNNINNQ